MKSNPILSGGGRKKKRKKEGNGGHDTTMTTNRLERPLHHHTVRVVRRCYGATVSTPDTLPPITFQWQRLCAGSGLNHLLHSSSIHSQIIQIQSLPNVLIARKSQFKVKSFKWNHLKMYTLHIMWHKRLKYYSSRSQCKKRSI